MAHTLTTDLDGAELARIGVRSSPLARRALSDARHARLDASVAFLVDDMRAAYARNAERPLILTA